MNIASYITPVGLRQSELNTERETHDNILAELCLEASRDWEGLCGGKKFYPYKATKLFDHPELKNDEHSTLRVGDEILQVISMTTRNTAESIATSDIILRNGPPPHGLTNESPYDRIELKYGSTGYTTNFQWADTPQQANSVVAFWGYVPGWTGAVATDSCWIDSMADIQSVTSSTITVDSLAGVNGLGLYPRVRKFDLVMWFNTTYTDMEMGFVIDIEEETGILTVNRGVNGTSVATPSGTPSLYVYRPPADIVRAVRRLAAFYYRARATSRGDIDRPVLGPGGTLVLPAGLPKDVGETMMRYQGVLD